METTKKGDPGVTAMFAARVYAKNITAELLESVIQKWGFDDDTSEAIRREHAKGLEDAG